MWTASKPIYRKIGTEPGGVEMFGQKRKLIRLFVVLSPSLVFADVSLENGPYLQRLDHDSVTICVELELTGGSQVPESYEVQYSLDGENWISQTSYTTADPGGVYEVVRSDLPASGQGPLSANTVYFYQIVWGGEVRAGPYKFRTFVKKHWSAGLETSAFYLLALGDNRWGGATKSQFHNIIDNLMDAEFGADPNRDFVGQSRPRFLLHGGDYVDEDIFGSYTTGTGWHGRFFQGFAGPGRRLMQNVCLFPSQGNHEKGNSSCRYYQFFFPPENTDATCYYYSFDYNIVRVICLNDHYKSYVNSYRSAQNTWLQGQLESVNNRWCIVFFHVPYYDRGGHKGCNDGSSDNITSVAYSDWHSLLNDGACSGHSNIDRAHLIITSHSHNFQHHKLTGAGTTDPPIYVVSGGAGANLHDYYSEASCCNTADYGMVFPEYGNDEQEALAKTYHYLLIEIDGDTLTVTAKEMKTTAGGGVATMHTLQVTHPDQYFQRGDANDDDTLNVSDVVTIAHWQGGDATKTPNSFDSADVNDDGANNLADAIYLAEYLFQGGEAPPEPLNHCGTDPTSDSLRSWFYESCDCPE